MNQGSLPVLPIEIVYMIMALAPKEALCLSPGRRVEIVRRMTGLTMSAARASLVLEQRSVGNRDFQDLPSLFAGDTSEEKEASWREALWYAYSPRALKELVREGQLASSPLSFFDDDESKLYSYVKRAMFQGGDGGLAVARYLERAGPASDILFLVGQFEELIHGVKHAPTVRHLLRRLLDENDPSYEHRKRYQTSNLSAASSQVFSAWLSDCSPLALLVFQLWYKTDHNEIKRLGCESVPLLSALLQAHPRETSSLLLHLDVLSLMRQDERMDFDKILAKVEPIARPPDTFSIKMSRHGSSSSSSSLVYGSVSCSLSTGGRRLTMSTALCGWIIDDWFAQARRTDDWTGFAQLLACISKKPIAVVSLLVDAVPDHVLATHEIDPGTLRMLSIRNNAPHRLTKVVPFGAWIAAHIGRPQFKYSEKAFLCFGARERVLLRRAREYQS